MRAGRMYAELSKRRINERIERDGGESARREIGRVKIATAAEPVGGEGERGEFDEVIAQVDEGAVLELSEAAGFARHEEDFEAARVAGDFVDAAGGGEMVVG